MNTLAVKVYESTKDIVKLRQPVDKNKYVITLLICLRLYVSRGTP
jgi:hypothetical protein